MNDHLYIIDLYSAQAQPKALIPVEGRSSDKLIDEFRRSPRGDLRAVAALATIALETSPSVASPDQVRGDEGAP